MKPSMAPVAARSRFGAAKKLFHHWTAIGRYAWDRAKAERMPDAVAAAAYYALFGCFLSSGLNQCNIVYGSLGTLVAFMFWVFGINFVLFGGGHISAAIARETRGVEKRRRD